MKMPRGQYQGREIATLPLKYLTWAANTWKGEDERPAIIAEYKRRMDRPETILADPHICQLAETIIALGAAELEARGVSEHEKIVTARLALDRLLSKHSQPASIL